MHKKVKYIIMRSTLDLEIIQQLKMHTKISYNRYMANKFESFEAQVLTKKIKK